MLYNYGQDEGGKKKPTDSPHQKKKKEKKKEIPCSQFLLVPYLVLEHLNQTPTYFFGYSVDLIMILSCFSKIYVML